ncbi:MAG: WD40 repeat domain-containing protein [Planctomycetota bacterium]|nr:WD40 repeat domain-containing protein [Planctomycetota bacterium]
MTTQLEFNSRVAQRMQSSVSRCLAGLIPVSLSLLIFAAGCGGDDDDFGPTVIRSTVSDKDPPPVETPVVEPAPAANTVTEIAPQKQDENDGTSTVSSAPSATPVSAETDDSTSAVSNTPVMVVKSDGLPTENTIPETNSEIVPAGKDDLAMHGGPTVDRIPTAGSFARSNGNVAVFAGNDEHRLVIFDQYTGLMVSSFEYSGENSVTTVATNPDGDLVIAGMADGSVRAFRAVDTSDYDEYAKRILASIQQNAVGEKGHLGAVTQTLLPSNERVVTGGVDGHIRVWKIGDKESAQVLLSVVRDFSAHKAEILALHQLSGNRLMSAGADGQIRIWSIDDEDTLPTEVAEVGKEITAVSVSSDEKTIAVAHGQGSIQLLSLEFSEGETAQPIRKTTPVGTEKIPEIAHPDKVRAVALSADSKLLLTGCDDGLVRVWDVATDKLLEETLPKDGSQIITVGFPSPNADQRFQRYVVTTDAAGVLQWWPSGADPRDTRRTRKITQAVVRCEPAGLSVKSTTNESAGPEELTSGMSEECLTLHNQLRASTSAGSFDVNRKAILAAEPRPAVRNSTAETPSLDASFKTSFDFKTPIRHRDANGSVEIEFSADGSQIAVGRQEPTTTEQPESELHLWDLPTGVELRHWPAFSGRLQHLEIGGNGQNLMMLPSAFVLSRSTGRSTALSETPMMVTRSPDGRHFAIGVRGSAQTLGPVIRLIDAQTLREVAVFESYESYPTAMAFSSDGTTLVASIRERKAHKLIALEATSLKQTQLIEEYEHEQAWLLANKVGGTKAVTLILFSKDGRRIMTYGEYDAGTFRVGLWESKNSGWTEETKLRVETRKQVMAEGVESPARFLDTRGSRLVLAVATGYQILNLDEQRVEREIKLESQAKSRIVSPDGSMLAIGTEQGKIQLWKLDKESPMREFTAHLGPVVALKFSPDSARLATIGEENVVNIWQLDDWAGRSRRIANR